MKNLPVKLLYPALAAAALLSAASVGLFAATFQNYDECRCAPGPNNATKYTWDYCCGVSAWVSDYAQKTNCCNNSTTFKNNAANGCTTPTIKIASNTYSAYNKVGNVIYALSEPNSTCSSKASQCSGLAGAPGYGGAPAGYMACTQTYTAGQSCNPSTFTQCYQDVVFSAASSTPGYASNTYYNELDGTCTTCPGGLVSTTGTYSWLCKDTYGNDLWKAYSGRPKPASCLTYQCLCSATYKTVTCS